MKKYVGSMIIFSPFGTPLEKDCVQVSLTTDKGSVSTESKRKALDNIKN
jgi:hypothetical protein